jgi:P27 family predicted phage terminase small subunit
MGARGPAPRPTKLRLLNGRSADRDSGGRKVRQPPGFTRQAPSMPSWLSTEAKAEWKRIVPELERLNIVAPTHRAVLSALCECWSTYVDAVKLHRAEGLVLTNPTTERMHQHPAVGIAHNAAAQFLQFAREFGLTASAEQRLATAPDDGDDSNPFAVGPDAGA